MQTSKKPSFSLSFFSLAIIAAVLALSLVYFETVVKPAYALGVANHAATEDQEGIITFDGKVWVAGGSSSDDIFVYNAVTDALITSFACADCEDFVIANGGLYVMTSPAAFLYQIDTTGYFTSRSAVSTCINPIAMGVDIYCADLGNDAIDKFVVTGSTITKTDGGSLNSGSFACDQPGSLAMSSSDDVLFIACIGTTDRLVFITPISIAAASPTGGVNQSYGAGGSVVYSESNNKVITWGGTATALNGYTFSGGTLTGATAIFSSADWSFDGGSVDELHDRFAVASSTGTLYFIDAIDFDVLASVAIYADATRTSTDSHTWYSGAGNLMYATGGADDYWHEIDMVGIAEGSVGTGGSQGPTGVDSDGDGDIDFFLEDEDGDGVLDWDPAIVPIRLEDTATTLTNSLQMFGLDEDSAGLVGAMVIHLAFVGILGYITLTTRMQVPMFAWAFIFLLSGGISAALGLMDLLYFFAELVVIVSAFAFMMVKGIGQG